MPKLTARAFLAADERNQTRVRAWLDTYCPVPPDRVKAIAWGSHHEGRGQVCVTVTVRGQRAVHNQLWINTDLSLLEAFRQAERQLVVP